MSEPSAPTFKEDLGPTLSGQERPHPGGIGTKARRKVIVASFIGNFVEWFDYGAYSYLAVVIAAVFFPSDNLTEGLIWTFALFAVSFLVRPLGGFIWGHIGDRVGRRNALAWSILIMSASTVCIGLLPGAATLGLWAPALLLLFRVLQGFSASGEYAGASAYLVEYAPKGKRGIYAAVVPGSTAAGLLFGSLMATTLTASLTTAEMESWGWRLPFLLAAPLGLIGVYIRRKLEDSPVFQEMAQEDEAVKAPVWALFRDHWRALVRATAAVLLNAVGFYVILTYMPTYLSQTIGLDLTTANVTTTISLITYIGFIFLTGHLSDRFGRRKILMSASVLFILLTVPAFLLLGTGSVVVILLVQVLLGAMLTLNDGSLASFLAESFPTRVRYSGFAVSFNVGNAIFGGTAPAIATLLIASTGSAIAPGWYLMGAAVIALIAVWLSPETSHKELEDC
ncbi:MFS transporter [Enteractinococcus coprophilus]|uniref:Putative proline/betaine transporter n=1 Tax=Enteractinococcus coprophilus TaxID=1027633 RepID=A0A543ALV2_9MICC|nr:MFS transporter [Enteractinococcus coprophilus]TQL73573.1 MHS family proline/betaine transporter-like MFS transporter [Enteractinococcus coprophilus]